jgi:hypothetical protein
MKSFDCPSVMWLPLKSDSAHVYSGSMTRKCKTRSLLNQYLLGIDPNQILMQYKVNSKEFAVGLLYELRERNRAIRGFEDFRQQIIDWAEFAVVQMSNHEPISWPPPSVYELKKKAL